MSAPPTDTRVAGSLVGAATAASVLFSLVAALSTGFRDGDWATAAALGAAYWLIAMVVSVTTSLVAGLPLYYFLLARVRPRRRWAVVTGAGLAWLYPGLMRIGGLLSDVENKSDLLILAPFDGLLLLVGGFAGVVFWWLLTGSIGPQPVTLSGTHGWPPSR